MKAGEVDLALRRFDDERRGAPGSAVVGVDEVGRGCLAGPVVAAAVALDPAVAIPGIRDSKVLAPPVRDALAGRIRLGALAWAVSFVGPRVIERVNIRQATLLAMGQAVRRLRTRLESSRCPGGPFALKVLVDGIDVIPGSDLDQEFLVGGDGQSESVAAASIVAKATRDRFMVALDRDFPEYGFKAHKGYGTAEHLEALQRIGPCPWHRRTFAPVAQGSLFHARTGDH